MDPILKALRDYRLHASPEKKAADLKWLETECIAGVDAFAYLRRLSITDWATRLVSITPTQSFTINPEYNLDFSLSIRPDYADTCRFYV